MAFLAPKDDFSPASFAANWAEGKYTEALRELRDQAEKKAVASVKWYYAHRIWPCRFGRTIRVTCLILLMMAGILPMLNEIARSAKMERMIEAAQTPASVKSSEVESGAKSESKRTEEVAKVVAVSHYAFNPVWSSVLIAVAATLVGLDRLYGASSSWIRYVVTAQRISVSMEDFQLAMEEQKARWRKPEPTMEQACASLGLIRKFVQEVNKSLMEETNVWVSEISDALRKLDEQAKVGEERSSAGTVEISVTHAGVTPDNWQYSIDGSGMQQSQGETVRSALAVGSHNVKVTAMVGGEAKSGVKEFTVKAGQVTSVEVELS